MNRLVAVAASTLRSCVDERPRYPFDAGWQAEEDWFRNQFTPDSEVEYTIAREHAERQYERLQSSTAALDTKAEWLFGISVALLSAAYFAVREWSVFLLAFIPSGILLGMAIHLLVRTRIGDRLPFPMTAREVLDVSTRKYAPEAWIAASLHCATEGLRRVNSWKGDHLDAAQRCLLAGVIMFALPVAWESPSSRNSRLESPKSEREEHTLRAERPEPLEPPH